MLPIFLTGLFIGTLLGGILAYHFFKYKHHTPFFSQFTHTPYPSKSKNEKTTLDPLELKYHPQDEEITLNHLDINECLQLIEKYQKAPTPSLLKLIKRKIQAHTEEGNNVLHEYLTQDTVEIETVETIVAIDHAVLLEKNTEGETVLHVAEKYDHPEVIEWLMDETHFESPEEFEEFLEESNDEGNTALHEAADDISEESGMDTFLDMVEQHPKGCLLWKDAQGVTVYEHFFKNEAADGRQLLDVLVEKGVVEYEDDRYQVVDSEVLEELAEAQEESENITTLAKLCVKDYKRMGRKKSNKKKQVVKRAQHKISGPR